MLNTTVGQLMINESLPMGLRDYDRKLDKKGIADLLQQVAEEYPEEYRDVAKDLSDVGRDVAYVTGGNSFGLRHITKSPAARRAYLTLRKRLKAIQTNPRLSDKDKEAKIISAVGKVQEKLTDAIYDEALAEKNPLAFQVMSGSRGNPVSLRSLRGGDGLYVDGVGNVIPVPVLRSYSEGLTSVEYWAGTYGTRKGITDVKGATADAGYFAKQMNQLTHRLLVTALDDENDTGTSQRGLPVDIDDTDNEGALLALAIGGYKRNTILTPKILKDLKRRGRKRILIRSPMVGGPADGGVYARDVGVRERGGLAPVGDYVGLAAAQAIAEKLTQGQLSSKHTGGVAGESKAVSGFKYINQLVQVPKRFQGGAAHAQIDGKVNGIEKAPQGGHFVKINNESHYVNAGFDVKVKIGEVVEAGDVISDGIPNPADIVKHKGIGEGRRYFVKAFREAYTASGMGAHRRNLELISRGLINHVRLSEEMGDHVPGDVVPYSILERNWKIRAGAREVDTRQAVGKYLERPVLHHTIGTKIQPSMLDELRQFGVKRLEVHDDPPPFEPEMIRAASSIAHDPDWMTRMIGSGQKKSLLSAVHRGGTSDFAGTSYAPALARGESFGRAGATVGWKPAKL
jgi:DNA-directed RNA polymerase subunit beta'